VITAIVCGVIIAAPRPWNTRAVISIPIEPVNPHHTDASVNTTRPTRYSVRGPIRSPSRPEISSGTAYASRYALVTHTTLVTSVSRSVMIAGVAIDTIVESTRIMKKPITRAHNAGHGRTSWVRFWFSSWFGVAMQDP
jgi:hypothetical protein